MPSAIDFLRLKNYLCLSSRQAAVYEYRTYTVEENSKLRTGARFSFGNGATGYIGVPLQGGWELTEVSLHADTFAKRSEVELSLRDYTKPTRGAPILAQMAVIGSGDGFGDTNNAAKVVTFGTPISLPNQCILGVYVDRVKGTIRDVRLSFTIRRVDNKVLKQVDIQRGA